MLEERLRKLDCPREQECGEAWDPEKCWQCGKLLDPSGACASESCSLFGQAPRVDVCWRCLRRGVESRGVPRKLSEMLRPEEGELTSLDGPRSFLGLVYASYGTLGQDPNGRPLWSEQCKFLDEHQVRDLDERRRWQALWQVISREKAFALALKLEN